MSLEEAVSVLVNLEVRGLLVLDANAPREDAERFQEALRQMDRWRWDAESERQMGRC